MEDIIKLINMPKLCLYHDSRNIACMREDNKLSLVVLERYWNYCHAIHACARPCSSSATHRSGTQRGKCILVMLLCRKVSGML